MDTQEDQDNTPTMTSYNLPLELFLSSPICWKGSKSCEFLNVAHNCIKDDINYTKIQHFKSKLNLDAYSLKWLLWHPHTNWEDVLGNSHFNLLTTFHKPEIKTDKDGKTIVETKRRKLKLDNTTLVVDLLGQIRNKLEHNNLYEDEEKEELNWFCRLEDKWHFDKQLYANYWSKNIPRLEPFLWFHFREFRNWPTLRNFYPDSLEHAEYDCSEYFQDFQKMFQKALQINLEHGAVKARYSIKSAQQTWTLEFRTLPMDLILRLLEGSNSVEIHITQEKVLLKWFDKTTSNFSNNERIVNLQTKLNANTIYYITCVASNNVCDTCERVVSVIQNNEHVTSGTLISFSNSHLKEDIEKLVKTVASSIPNGKVESHPVSWEELSESTHDMVMRNGKFELPNCVAKFNQIFPSDFTARTKLLKYLQGQVLNSMLRHGKIEILSKYKIPNLAKIYIERKLFSRDKVHSIIFKIAPENHRFLITDITLASLASLVGRKHAGKITVIENNNLPVCAIKNPEYKIFILKNGSNSFDELVQRFGQAGVKTVHCLVYEQDEIFRRIARPRDIYRNQDVFFIASRKAGLLSESRFLRNISEQTIFIADKPGMGKSQVLISLARIIMEQYRDRFCILVDMNVFIAQIEENRLINSQVKCLDKSVIIQNIASFCCSNQFEENLVKYYLNSIPGHSSKNKIFLELMFDGLDEVKHDKREMAFEILTIIKTSLHTVRLWCSLRDHMLINILTRFGCLGYQLQPFTDKRQVEFIVECWKHSNWWKRPTCQKDTDKLELFARKSLKSAFSREETQVAGIPLQCRMIADINEKSVFSKNFKNTRKRSLIEVFESLFERKLEIYLIEKYKLYNISEKYDIVCSVRDRMQRSHIYFAIKLLFHDSVASKFRNRLLLNFRNTEVEQLHTVVEAQGIIQVAEPITFVHRTFAEYLVAQFVSQVLQKQFLDIQEDDPDFQEFLWNEVLAVDLTTTTPYEIEFFTIFKFPTVCHFLNTLLKHYTNPLSSKFLSKFLDILWSEFEFSVDFREEVPLFSAISYQKFANMFTLIWNCPNYRKTLFINALKCHAFDISKFLIEEWPEFSPKHWEDLEEFAENCNYTVLHWVIVGIFVYAVDDTSEEEIRLQEFIKYLLKKDGSILEKKDSLGQNPLTILSRKWMRLDVFDYYYYIIGMVNFFATDLKADLNAKDSQMNSLLHVTENLYIDNVENLGWKCDLYITLCEIFIDNGIDRSFLNSVNVFGNAPIHCALECFGDSATNAVNFLGELGADLNAKSGSGSTCLHISIEQNLPLTSIQRQIESFGADPSLVNAKGQSALHLAVEKRDLMLVRQLISTGKPGLLYIRDNKGKTVLQNETSKDIRKLLICTRRIFYVDRLLTLLRFIQDFNRPLHLILYRYR